MSIRQRVHAFMHPNALAHVAQPHRAPFVAQRGLRRGMWVTLDGTTVGILTALDDAGTATVQLVEADGTNRLRLEKQANGEQLLVSMSIQVTAVSLRQAFHEQIPEARRPPSDHSARLGYRRRGK